MRCTPEAPGPCSSQTAASAIPPLEHSVTNGGLVSRSARRSVRIVTAVTPPARGDGMGAMTCRRAAAWLLLALVAGVGCTNARPDTTPTPPSTKTPASTSSRPTPDPETSAKAAVLAAYRGFWTAASSAERHPQRSPSALKRFATDKALANALATIALYRQQGILVRGEPKHDPQVIALALSVGPAMATIRDCVDLTGVQAIYRKTGKSALAPNQSQRHVATAQAVVADGRWVIRAVAADRKQPC